MATNDHELDETDELELLTAQQVLKVIPASLMTLWRWEQKGILVPIRIGKRRYYGRVKIKRLASRGTNG